MEECMTQQALHLQFALALGGGQIVPSIIIATHKDDEKRETED